MYIKLLRWIVERLKLASFTHMSSSTRCSNDWRSCTCMRVPQRRRHHRRRQRLSGRSAWPHGDQRGDQCDGQRAERHGGRHAERHAAEERTSGVAGVDCLVCHSGASNSSRRDGSASDDSASPDAASGHTAANAATSAAASAPSAASDATAGDATDKKLAAAVLVAVVLSLVVFNHLVVSVVTLVPFIHLVTIVLIVIFPFVIVVVIFRVVVARVLGRSDCDVCSRLHVVIHHQEHRLKVWSGDIQKLPWLCIRRDGDCEASVSVDGTRHCGGGGCVVGRSGRDSEQARNKEGLGHRHWSVGSNACVKSKMNALLHAMELMTAADQGGAAFASAISRGGFCG